MNPVCEFTRHIYSPHLGREAVKANFKNKQLKYTQKYIVGKFLLNFFANSRGKERFDQMTND